jgi:hypothetical protein
MKATLVAVTIFLAALAFIAHLTQTSETVGADLSGVESR